MLPIKKQTLIELMLKLRSVNGLSYLKADNVGEKLGLRARNNTGE